MIILVIRRRYTRTCTLHVLAVRVVFLFVLIFRLFHLALNRDRTNLIIIRRIRYIIIISVHNRILLSLLLLCS